MTISKKTMLIVVGVLLFIGAGAYVGLQYKSASDFDKKVAEYLESWDVGILKENIQRDYDVAETAYNPQNCQLLFAAYDEDFDNPSAEVTIGGLLADRVSPLEVLGGQAEQARNAAPTFSSPLSFLPGMSSAVDKSHDLYNKFEAVRKAAEMDDKAMYCSRIHSGLTMAAQTVDRLGGELAFFDLNDEDIKSFAIEDLQLQFELSSDVTVPEDFKTEHEAIIAANQELLELYKNNSIATPQFMASIKVVEGKYKQAVKSIAEKSTYLKDQIKTIYEASQQI